MSGLNNTKNKLLDLNNHLFEQLERLNDDDLKGDDLAEEIKRAKSVGFVASQIINNAKLALDAQKIIYEHMIKNPPGMLGMDGYDGGL